MSNPIKWYMDCSKTDKGVGVGKFGPFSFVRSESFCEIRMNTKKEPKYRKKVRASTWKNLPSLRLYKVYLENFKIKNSF